MAWLIMNDETKYGGLYYPTHILSKDSKPIPVFIGASNCIFDNAIGIYVRDEDFNLIRHDKAYIFIHDPDVKEEDIEKVNWDDVEDKKGNRVHYHLWEEDDYNFLGEGEENQFISKGGSA